MTGQRHTALTGLRNMIAAGEPQADNVVRRRELEAANPDVRISFEKRDGAGAGWWSGWAGSIVIDGEERAFRAHALGVLLGMLEPLAARRAEAVADLMSVWGDDYEDIRVDADGWVRGRQRDGEGRELAGKSAGELAGVFRADREREIFPPDPGGLAGFRTAASREPGLRSRLPPLRARGGPWPYGECGHSPAGGPLRLVGAGGRETRRGHPDCWLRMGCPAAGTAADGNDRSEGKRQ